MTGAEIGLDPKAIEQAREEFEFGARAVATLRQRKDWTSHDAVVFLAFYLARADYELKVLIDRLWREPKNRAVWEKYLGLELFECVERLPRLVSQVLRPDRTMNEAMRARYRTAFQRYKEAVAPIRRDQRFWETLTMLRNEVAAHHGSKQQSRGLNAYAAWALASTKASGGGVPILTSQILDYAHSLGRAIQQFGGDLTRESYGS